MTNKEQLDALQKYMDALAAIVSGINSEVTYLKEKVSTLNGRQGVSEREARFYGDDLK
jgi:hypothetical protein